MKKRIVLCADDYGQEQELSEVILALIATNRLSATSCLVNFPNWRKHAKQVKTFLQKIDIGWHVNFTEGYPLSKEYRSLYGDSFQGLKVILRAAFSKKLQLAALIAECRTQLDQFVQEVGQLPDFIDGHQHVHQFPLIRQALMEVYKEYNLRAYCRWVTPRIWGGGMANTLKKSIISLTGSGAFYKLLQAHQIPHNTSFTGIYDFKQSRRYPKLFRQFLAEIGDGGLILCHPGVSGFRLDEWNYLKSQQFTVDCDFAQVVLARGDSFKV